MLYSINQFYSKDIFATDGKFGECKDFIFNDKSWVIRYMVVETGNWLPGRKVLISPNSIIQSDLFSNKTSLSLSKNDIENCPPLESNAPVSREYEIEFYKHYGYTMYWLEPGLWGTHPDPSGTFIPIDNPDKDHDNKNDIESSNHLRSCSEIVDYDIEAKDGTVGYVENYVFDVAKWKIIYLVLDTRKWFPGESKVLSTIYISKIDWANKKIYINKNIEEIKFEKTLQEEWIK